MSAKVRNAVEIIATQGKTVRQAAAEAGMNESALSRALHRPGMQQYLEARKALICEEIDKLRAQYRALALRTGAHLMTHAASENVRARMVEFFAGESRKDAAPQVNVQINQTLNGYEYVRPGQRVVDITDCESVDPDGQTPEKPSE